MKNYLKTIQVLAATGAAALLAGCTTLGMAISSVMPPRHEYKPNTVHPAFSLPTAQYTSPQKFLLEIDLRRNTITELEPNNSGFSKRYIRVSDDYKVSGECQTQYYPYFGRGIRAANDREQGRGYCHTEQGSLSDSDIAKRIELMSVFNQVRANVTVSADTVFCTAQHGSLTCNAIKYP